MSKELSQLAEEELLKKIGGSYSVLLGYLEHQVDLQGKMFSLLNQAVEDSGVVLPEELTSLMLEHEKIMEKSSINFDDLANPMEAYKLPKTVETKSIIRNVQVPYLKRKVSEGVF